MSTNSITKQIQELHLNLQILSTILFEFEFDKNVYSHVYRNSFINYHYQHLYYLIAVMISCFLPRGKSSEFLAPANFNVLQFNVQ